MDLEGKTSKTIYLSLIHLTTKSIYLVFTIELLNKQIYLFTIDLLHKHKSIHFYLIYQLNDI